MEDPFLPWWLMLLLGTWAIAFTVWNHLSIHREIRIWAGVATLVYFLLIFLALRGTPHTVQRGLEPPDFVNETILWILIGAALTACLGVLGRFSLTSRAVAFGIFTTMNAGVAFQLGQAEVALALLVIAVFHVQPIVSGVFPITLPRLRNRLRRLARFEKVPYQSIDTAEDDQPGEDWLTGSLAIVLALLLLGTISFAFRTEIWRAASSPRHSILPSRELLEQTHAAMPVDNQPRSPADFLLGTRSDLVVLIMVIVFLHLAITTIRPLDESRPVVPEIPSPPDIARLS